MGRPWQVRMKASRSTHSSSPVPAASALKPKQGTSTRRTRKSTREPKPRRLYPLVHGGRYRANCHSTVNDVFRVLSWEPGFKFGAIRRSPGNPVNPCDYGVFCLLRSEMFLLYPASLRISVSWAKSCPDTSNRSRDWRSQRQNGLEALSPCRMARAFPCAYRRSRKNILQEGDHASRATTENHHARWLCGPARGSVRGHITSIRFRAAIHGPAHRQATPGSIRQSADRRCGKCFR